jgi:microsomal dipeptidase-like Zn-dependent dipeptidase
MATRASRLNSDHVQALNGIELAFYGGGEKEKRVREAWNAYHNHLNDKSYQPDRIPEWVVRQIDLLIDLLHEMAVCLGYDFDKTHLKSSWYSPEAHGTMEQELNLIRGGLAEVLTGKRSFPVVALAASEDEARQVAELRTLLIEWLKASPKMNAAVAAQKESQAA